MYPKAIIWVISLIIGAIMKIVHLSDIQYPGDYSKLINFHSFILDPLIKSSKERVKIALNIKVK